MARLIVEIFFGINKAQAFANTHILPLVTDKRLYELPNMWLLNRVHPIIEQRQKTPTSRVDVLQLMLEVMTDEPIRVHSEMHSCRPSYPFALSF